MRRKSYADMNCPVAQALDVVGDPWTLLIVRDAMWGYHRFGDFQDRLGIPRNTLTDRLAGLVEAGVFRRVAYQDSPPRYEYRLTEKGRALAPVLMSLLKWGDEWTDIDGTPVSLIDQDTGAPVDPLLIDANTRRPLAEMAVRAVGPSVQRRVVPDEARPVT